MTFCCGIRDKRNVLPIGSCKTLMMKRHTSVFCRFFIKDFPFSKVFVCHRYNRSIREALSWLQFFLYYLHRAFSNAVVIVYICMEDSAFSKVDSSKKESCSNRSKYDASGPSDSCFPPILAKERIEGGDEKWMICLDAIECTSTVKFR